MSVATVIRPSILSLVTLCSLCIVIPLESFAELPSCSMLFRDTTYNVARFYRIDKKKEESIFETKRTIEFSPMNFVKLGTSDDDTTYILLSNEGVPYYFKASVTNSQIYEITDNKKDIFLELVKETDTSAILLSGERVLRVQADAPSLLNPIVTNSELPELKDSNHIRVLGKNEFLLVSEYHFIHFETKIAGGIRKISKNDYTKLTYDSNTQEPLHMLSILEIYPFSYGERAWVFFISREDFSKVRAKKMQNINNNQNTTQHRPQKVSFEYDIYAVSIELPSLRQLGRAVFVEKIVENEDDLHLYKAVPIKVEESSSTITIVTAGGSLAEIDTKGNRYETQNILKKESLETYNFRNIDLQDLKQYGILISPLERHNQIPQLPWTKKDSQKDAIVDINRAFPKWEDPSTNIEFADQVSTMQNLNLRYDLSDAVGRFGRMYGLQKRFSDVIVIPGKMRKLTPDMLARMLAAYREHP